MRSNQPRATRHPAERSRTGRAAGTYATGLVHAAATMAAGLVATPFLKTWLGEARFGAVRTLAELTGYLGLLELGLGAALAPLLARALAESATGTGTGTGSGTGTGTGTGSGTGTGGAAGGRNTLVPTVAAGVRAYAGITLLVLVVGLALAGPLPRLVRLDPELAGELRAAWVVGLAGWLALVLHPFRVLLEAANRGDRVHLVLTGQALVVTALTLVFAWAGWGLVGQALALAAGTLLGASALAVLGVRSRPGRGLVRAVLTERVEPAVREGLWRVGWPTVLLKLSGQVSLMTDYLVLSAVRGAAQVTPLFLTQRLAVLAQQQLQGVGVASWAGLVELYHRGEHDRFRRRIVELTGLVALLGFTVLGPIVAYNHHFVALWVGAGSDAGARVVLVAAVNALLQGLVSLWTYVPTGTGQVSRVVGPALAASALNLAASVALTRTFGLIGPLLGTLTAFLAVHVWFLPLLLWRGFGVRPRELLGAVVRPAVVGVPYAVLLWAWARTHRPWGWTGLGLEMTAAALGFLALGGRLALDAGQRAAWRARLRALVAGHSR